MASRLLQQDGVAGEDREDRAADQKVDKVGHGGILPAREGRVEAEGGGADVRMRFGTLRLGIRES